MADVIEFWPRRHIKWRRLDDLIRTPPAQQKKKPGGVRRPKATRTSARRNKTPPTGALGRGSTARVPGRDLPLPSSPNPSQDSQPEPSNRFAAAITIPV